MSSTSLTFRSRDEHRAHLAAQAALPAGFRVGTTRLSFAPVEAPRAAHMTMTLVALDRATPDFAAVFTRNAFPGAPVMIGRRRLSDPAATLGAFIVNNKISNVCAPDGVANAETVCGAVAARLGLTAAQVLPFSTGIIGWRLPIDEMVSALPAAVAALAPGSVLPAAEGIMTTDLYPKVRRAAVGGGSIVGIAKGAGMIEPHMATMLAFLLTDLAVPRAALQSALARAVDRSFNLISVDSDTSTSDSVLAVATGAHPCPDLAAFERALVSVCQDLAEDVVRNGEGVHHVLRAVVRGCPSDAVARGLGKAIINSPLVKTAICGNDPNVGRIVAALGKHLGALAPSIEVGNLRLSMGGHLMFERGTFVLDAAREAALVEHLEQAELYASRDPDRGIFRPTVDYPPHERCVDLVVDLGLEAAEATVLGADLSHEYISENADYRS